MLDRRGFLLGTSAIAVSPAIAATTPAPPKIAAIRWPAPGHALHGYMAIPAAARGRQPAVLVVPDSSGADSFALGLTDALAVAGFVACIPKALGSLDDALATVRWLATNAYATGKVGAIGLGWGGELVDRVAAAPQSRLTAAVTFGASGRDVWPIAVRRFAAIGGLAGSDYDAAWRETIAFLKEQLG